jgi:hypothetical protein
MPINLNVKLTQERLDLKAQIIFIPQTSFDAKLLMIARRMHLEVTCVLVSFFDCYHEWDQKRAHMMLVSKNRPRDPHFGLKGHVVEFRK